ncbi:sulfatase [Mangrovibacterium marinum]|uniref:Arylsulfatase A-like enzyme n=1 Tax=Mangrovibacterium marinum TaxID=1639118 RepID=A0A2T5BXY2_9BACT|nr:sulfatase [Mangrovibacterium marinum]PTN06297.1 arylsulfatase A-like enzyme [Mangrovibacterium marinum]
MKRNLMMMCGLASLAAGCTSTQPKEVKPQKPNIIFIMTDDHSFQTLGAYDSTLIKTPGLDRIANEGVTFSNSFVCNSICAPSRAAMLTGKHSHANGQRDNADTFDGSQQTFPKLLHQAGYQTALIGKWHLKSQPTGFDYWNILPGQGSYYNPDFIDSTGQKHYDGYVTDLITDFSTDWLDHRDKDKPFCMLVHHKAVHRVWMPPTKYLNEFKDRKFEVPENFFDDYEGRIAASQQEMSIIKDMDLVYDLKMLDKEGDIKSRLRGAYQGGAYARMNEEQRAAWDAVYDPIIADFRARKLTGRELAEWKYNRYMQDYLACVKSLDDNVARLLKYLDDNGLAENTLVVYTSDQGFYMGEHGWFDKRFMYEESFRTPLLMRFPKAYTNAHGKIDQLVQNIDYAPTFLDLAGVAVPEDIQGESLLPLVGENAPEHWRNGLYYHYYEYPAEHAVKRHYGIRTNRYKLIHFYNDIDAWELYDLQNDPHEMHNLYGQSEYQELADSLKTQLLNLQQQYQDPIINQ